MLKDWKVVEIGWNFSIWYIAQANFCWIDTWFYFYLRCSLFDALDLYIWNCFRKVIRANRPDFLELFYIFILILYKLCHLVDLILRVVTALFYFILIWHHCIFITLVARNKLVGKHLLSPWSFWVLLLVKRSYSVIIFWICKSCWNCWLAAIRVSCIYFIILDILDIFESFNFLNCRRSTYILIRPLRILILRRLWFEL